MIPKIKIMNSCVFFGALGFSSLFNIANALVPDQTVVLTSNSWRFSFVSCNDYPSPDVNQSTIGGNAGTKLFDWGLVSERRPDALVWGGDIVYGDFPRNATYLPPPLGYLFPSIPLSITPFVPTPGLKLDKMYSALKADTKFSALLAQLDGRHIGTW
jgi:hypothetical protein